MKYNKKVLKNGLTILTVPMKESPTVTFMVWANAGSEFESKKENGLSHFLEHACFKGTKKWPNPSDFRIQLDGIGAMSNAFTSNEVTTYHAKSHPKHLNKIMEVISDMYLNPIFSVEEIEKEKGVILGEIDMYADNNRFVVSTVLKNLMFKGQPASMDVLGTKKNIKRFKKEDFVKYRAKHYVASATTIVVAGKFDENKTIKKIETLFREINISTKSKKDKVKDIQKSPQILIKDKKIDQTHFIIGFRSINMFDKDEYVLSVLNTILGGNTSSRLWNKLREEMGLGYYVGSTHDSLTDYGTELIYAGISHEKSPDGISAALEEIRKITKEKVGKDELRRAKDYILGVLPMGLESSDKVAGFVGWQASLGKDIVTPEEEARRIEKVTSMDVQRLAKKIFQNSKMNLAIVGPHKDKKKFSKIFKL